MTHDLRPTPATPARRPAAGRRSGAALAELVERDYLEYATSFAAVPAISVVRTPELLLRRGALDHPYLNVVLGTWTDAGSLDRVIGEARATLGGPGRAFTWSVWPSNGPADLRSRLEAAGLRYEDDGPLMVLDLAHAELPVERPPGLTVEVATDEAALAEAGAVAMSMMGDDAAAVAAFTAAYRELAFGPDRSLTIFMGRLDGVVVATSALYTGTGLAGIYGVGTLPEMRGRGYGRVLTAAALAHGRRRGLRLGALLSSELGLPVYRRLGFREVGSVSFLTYPADGSVSPASPPSG